MDDYATKSQVKGIERQIEVLQREASNIGQTVNSVNSSVKQINSELNELKNQFRTMIENQRKEALLQRATTEVVRIRQEIDNEFGNYKIVRETMLGVLQATDAALVKQTTISRVSEELMLSTPEYWLAPCLVAVAAWIGNDRDLAERAIREAIKRDEEKTAITMALICRRNRRTETCYEWLSVYFSKQDPAAFNEGDFAYIDAYANGVFGPDEKHICDGYFNRWIKEIKKNDAAYEAKQTELWKNYCLQFTKSIGTYCKELQEVSEEFPRIDSYVSRIDAVDKIRDKFFEMGGAYVDCDLLKKEIDMHLIELIVSGK